MMRVLTVRQPWAWAIVQGGKDVENRTRNVPGAYRGPVAIHAGLGTDLVGAESALVQDAWYRETTAGRVPYPPAVPGTRRDSSIYLDYGAIIGVAELVDVHNSGSADCCSDWSEFGAWHLVLENPRSLEHPIPFKGGLGLRRLDDGTRIRVESELV